MTRSLRRVFAWDEGARPGAPFSAEYLPPQSGRGRFDLLAHVEASSWYLVESAEHAVAEKIQDLRNRVLRDDFLFERGHRLASCEVDLDGGLRVADLCDPRELADRETAPDRLASWHRSVTRPIAALGIEVAGS